MPSDQILRGRPRPAAESPFPVDALVFDAYGTLFDVHSITVAVERLLPGHAQALSQLWRGKQLEYKA